MFSEGAPLRLYLTRKIPRRLGAPVEAKVLEPVFAFDREVIPAGTLVFDTPIGSKTRVFGTPTSGPVPETLVFDTPVLLLLGSLVPPLLLRCTSGRASSFFLLVRMMLPRS